MRVSNAELSSLSQGLWLFSAGRGSEHELPLLSKTIDFADSISYGSQNNIEANWQRWLRAESLLAASCGF